MFDGYVKWIQDTFMKREELKNIDDRQKVGHLLTLIFEYVKTRIWYKNWLLL